MKIFQNKVIIFIAVVFIAWAMLFIYRTSFIAIDGRRYFCLFDDAMISMRYAWNFAHGIGLVWNPGEYIQGYTNLLMVLLMSLPSYLLNKSAAVLFVQVVGVGVMVLNAYISVQIADHFVKNESPQKKAFIKTLSFFCVLFYYPLAYWTLMGMETGLLTLFLLLGVLSSLNYTVKNDPVQIFKMSGYLGLAYLTRNDSLVFGILIWLFVIYETLSSKNNHKYLGSLVGAAFFYFLFIIGQGIFQNTYYGEWLPNTYTLKLEGISLAARIKNGFGFALPFIVVTSILYLVSAIDLILDFRRNKLLLLLISVSALAYQIYVGGDPWRYWRIIAPTMPLLFILFTCAISSFSKALVFRNLIAQKEHMAKPLTLLFVLLGLVLANVHFLPEITMLIKPYTTQANQINVNRALAINELTTSNASVGVYWAGTIPYYTDKYAIDFLGKSDKRIARLSPDPSISWNGMEGVPGHNKYDLDYSIKFLKPTYVENFKWGIQDLSSWAESNYEEINYRGVSLYLLKESQSVLWDKVKNP